MKGARIIFYISDESNVRLESKLAPYRAQIMARAVENNVFIVQSNAPANPERRGGSHGQSRVILPDGNIVEEARIFGDQVIITDLDLNETNGVPAINSLRSELFAGWWKDGMKLLDSTQGGLLRLCREARAKK